MYHLPPGTCQARPPRVAFDGFDRVVDAWPIQFTYVRGQRDIYVQHVLPLPTSANVAQALLGETPWNNGTATLVSREGLNTSVDTTEELWVADLHAPSSIVSHMVWSPMWRRGCSQRAATPRSPRRNAIMGWWPRSTALCAGVAGTRNKPTLWGRNRTSGEIATDFPSPVIYGT